jgi:NADPH:quinone reductase-like Zn-dependent oxidoreductase
MQAVVVDPQSPDRVAFAAVEPPTLRATEALIRVKAISLNAGEVMYGLRRGEAGTRLGSDLAGVVEQPAQEGPGPARGSRVVGLVPSGAWAEYVAVPVNALAELEPSVTFAQAAALPVAGLTALAAIDQGGSVIARPVLVTGASGGVGLMACQLASLAGASVAGQVRQSRSAALVHQAGAEHVVVAEDVAPAAQLGPYQLIVEQLGGEALAQAMTQLVPGGTCVAIGGLAGHQVPIDLALMRGQGGGGVGDACLRFFNLFREFQREPAATGLQRLVRLAGHGKLVPHLGAEADWREIGQVARALIGRQFPGKAVLHISDQK